MSAPDVSVVVATRNRAAQLAELFDSLARQTLSRSRFEVVVVDDGSADSTAAVLAREEARLAPVVVRRVVPGGPAAARNDGWRRAQAPLVAFTDDDCVATAEWLETVVATADRHPSAVVQGRTDADPRQLHRLGPFARTVVAHGDGPNYQTCNIAYPRELLERQDGFDVGSFPRSGEDTDLAWRARAAGAPIVYADTARVHHAVTTLGPRGKLRVAARWSDSMQVYVRYPELRARVFTKRFFWKGTHYLLFRLLLAAVLPRRLMPVRLWLGLPYFTTMSDRARAEGGGGPQYAPWYLLHDLVEMAAVARAAVRHRRPML